MLSRVIVVGVLILALMIAVKDGAMHNVGLTGSCRAQQTLADGSEWITCNAGRISGRPSLSSKSCTSSGVRGKLEWWHCPASVANAALR